jgi:hypothetical protein
VPGIVPKTKTTALVEVIGAKEKLFIFNGLKK